MSATVHGFQTEVTKLLNLLANSLYSNKEVFLRELISNASDAIDKLHFLSLTKPELIQDDPEFKIRIRADKELKTLTIEDNGVGMTLEEANTHLGTIAKSGTEDFVKKLSGDQAKDSQLIGQFGVGFYSAFIVADQVVVISRSASVPAEEGVRWSSNGSGTFESENITVPERGTKIILHLKDDETSFLEPWTLRQAITKYSDHISVPVMLWDEVPDDSASAEPEDTVEGEESAPKAPKMISKYVQINDAKALWTRSAKEVTDDEYKSFYKHAFGDYTDPLTWTHNKVEGELEYTSLLYLPQNLNMEMRYRENNHGIKLYVQRVFIMDEDDQFLPSYLRFIRGIIDTNALPLNVSRELLQESAVTRKLKSALTKRSLSMLEKLSADKDKYAQFISQFNDILKEGLSDDYKNHDQILKLIRFASTYDTSSECHVSLQDYVSRMKEGQKNIYYLCADDYDKAVNSSYLERMKSRGLEVLLLWKQPIDPWICGYLREFEGKNFVSVMSDDLDLGDLENETVKQEQEQLQKDNSDLIAHFKSALGSQVLDVKVSSDLTQSPACLVRSSKDSFFNEQMRLFAKIQGNDLPDEKYILELNPNHELVKMAQGQSDEAAFKDYAQFIFLQAELTNLGTLKNPAAFATLMNRIVLGKAGQVPTAEAGAAEAAAAAAAAPEAAPACANDEDVPVVDAEVIKPEQQGSDSSIKL